MSALTKFFFKPTVAVIKIRGSINAILVNQIQKQLQHINKNTVQALALVVNSQSGCPYETHLLATRIKLFAEQAHVPIYTFAEEKAISTGYQLLSIGKKVYAQPTSVIGQTGVVTTLLRAKQLFIDQGINPLKMTSNKNISSYYEDYLVEPGQHVNKIINQQLEEQNELMVNEVKSNRKNIKVSDSQLRDNLFFGKKAQIEGLIDELGTYEVILNQLYPQAMMVSLSKQSRLKQLEGNFYFLLKLTQSRGFMFLIGILFIKFLIKWAIIITMWRKVRKQKKSQSQK